MNYENQSRMQVLRIDAAGAFVEIMADGVAIDKAVINFVSYDKSKAGGERVTANVKFYVPITKAKALSEKILSLRIAKAAKLSVEKAQEAGKKYPDPVFTEMGGTPAAKANRKDGKALSRTMTIAPGSKMPYVLTAESGPGIPGPNGLLIVPDYGYGKAMTRPEQIVRIPMTGDALEEFAVALDAVYQTWVQTRFVPIVQPEVTKRNLDWQARFGGNRVDSGATVDFGDEDENGENEETPAPEQQDDSTPSKQTPAPQKKPGATQNPPAEQKATTTSGGVLIDDDDDDE